MSAQQRPAKPATPETPPAYYIATAPLFIDDQFSRAHNVGDPVPAEHVERYGWHDKVRRPDADTPETPNSEPARTRGQATSDKEGDA